MRVLITGANGFVGKNLAVRLAEREDVEVVSFTRDHAIEELPKLIKDVDFVFHLAGVNRLQNDVEFTEGNSDLTRMLCSALEKTGRNTPVLFSSSIQVSVDNPYGRSKLEAERVVTNYSKKSESSVYLFTRTSERAP